MSAHDEHSPSPADDAAASGSVSDAADLDRGDEERTPENGSPVGGDKGTEDQLDADNAVEEDQLRALDPDGSPA